MKVQNRDRKGGLFSRLVALPHGRGSVGARHSLTVAVLLGRADCVSIKEMQAERTRIRQARLREKHWKRWGPYLTERAWGNPREDYSAYGTAWDYFTHDHARSQSLSLDRGRHRAASATITSASASRFAFWNGCDPILKERLFGLGGPEGNHGEDVKEYYYYLDSTPTHSYMKCLYKYPQSEFPYTRLVDVNRQQDASADPSTS